MFSRQAGTAQAAGPHSARRRGSNVLLASRGSPPRPGLISACILIRTERGRMEELAKKLRQIPQIKRAFPVLGRYDIVADVEAANGKQLARAVTKTMRLGGVVFTETLPEVEE